MPFREITKSQFEAILQHTDGAPAERWAEQRAWFTNSDETLAGVVVGDSSCRTWGFVVLQQQSAMASSRLQTQTSAAANSTPRRS